MATKARSTLGTLSITLVAATGVLYFALSDESAATPEVPYGCSADNGVYVQQGELPSDAIMRAADAILPEGMMDIENFGDAAGVLVRQYEGGIVPPAAYVSVCVTPTKVLSVNGDTVV